MLVNLQVGNLGVDIALDEEVDIDAAMEMVGRIKTLAEDLLEFNGVEVYIADNTAEEEEEEEEEEE
jgi:hypothetical protein